MYRVEIRLPARGPRLAREGEEDTGDSCPTYRSLDDNVKLCAEHRYGRVSRENQGAGVGGATGVGREGALLATKMPCATQCIMPKGNLWMTTLSGE